MEWKLADIRKTQYDNLLKSAQDLEANIGSSQYRIAKLLDMRKDIDNTLRAWWEEVIKDMALDPKKDYVITQDGVIKDVTKEAPASKVGTNAAELK